MSVACQSISLVRQVVDAIRQVTGAGDFALHQPSFGGNELNYVRACIESTYVSSVGSYVDRFEAELAEYTGSAYAVAVVNGTAALHTALILSGVEANDEVLVPALSFVATANAVSYCGAHPHFVDSEPVTLGMDIDKLKDYLQKTTEQRNGLCINRANERVIRTIVPMHTFGHPVDMEGLLKLANDFNLTVVEDAAESLGSFYHDAHTGTLGQSGILSFNGNKTITTGGGGAILTQDKALAARARHITTTAKIPHRWEYRHDQIGYNYRMPNLNAALGCAQLERLPQLIAAKRTLATRYKAVFEDVVEVNLVVEPPGCRSNYWLQSLLLSKQSASQRDDILEATCDSGLMTRPAWSLINEFEPYKKCCAMDLTGARSLAGRLVNIPSSSNLITLTPGMNHEQR